MAIRIAWITTVVFGLIDARTLNRVRT